MDDLARDICQRILADMGPDRDELAHEPGLRGEVESRLRAVGYRLGISGGKLWAVAESAGEEVAYTDVQLAALAELAMLLIDSPGPERLTVDAFHQRLSRHGKWSKDWVRRAVLGPLERDRYVKVTTPGARRSEAFIQPGPRLALIDTHRLDPLLDRAGRA